MYEKMHKICPDVVENLIKYRNSSIAEYAAELWKAIPDCDNKLSIDAKKHLYQALKEEMQSQLDEKDVDDALNEFMSAPVIQTGPHCQLLIDKCNFYSAIFSLYGIKHYGRRFYFLYNCSTTTLETKTKFGPGWVKFKDCNINVFGLSRQTLSKTSVFSIRGPLSFKLQVLENINDDEIRNCLDDIRKRLQIGIYDNAVTAFNQGNHALWKSWNANGRFKPVFLEEKFLSRLLINNLKDKGSFIHKLFSNIFLIKRIKEGLAEESKLPTFSMLPQQTELLWLNKDRRIQALEISGGFLKEQNKPDGYKVEYSIANIIKGLEEGVLIPNLFIVFSMVSILPAARVVGGLHQMTYYPSFQRIFMSLLDSNNPEEKSMLHYLNRNCNHAWGTHVLEEPADVSALLTQSADGSQIENVMDQFEELTLWKATRGLEILRKYYRWGPLICNC